MSKLPKFPHDVLLLLSLLFILYAEGIASIFYGLASSSHFLRALGFVVFFYSFLKYLQQFKKTKTPAIATLRFYKALVGLILVFFAITQVIIELNSKDEEITTDTQFVIILGAGLDGEKPSAILVSRLDKSLAFMHAHPEIKAILCGGRGPDENISEANAMYRYLVANGISSERLFCENYSRTTHENIANARNYLASNFGISVDTRIKAAIVSSDFHLFRAKFIAKYYNIDAYSISSPTPDIGILPLYYRLREGAAIMVDILEIEMKYLVTYIRAI